MDKINKSTEAYMTIGEVAKKLDLVDKNSGHIQTHTIRYWEKQFKQIKPRILSGNRRYYDPTSIKILKKIKFLLKEKGMTISGVKKLLNNKSSLDLDEFSNNSITTSVKLKNKLKNISNLIKNLKKLK